LVLGGFAGGVFELRAEHQEASTPYQAEAGGFTVALPAGGRQMSVFEIRRVSGQ
jgi:hypothetical protein